MRGLRSIDAHRSLEWLPAGFARAAAVLLGGRAGFHALGIVSGVLLARGLGPAGRGAFFAVLLWPTILGWLATLGITKATTYLRARHPEYERDLASIGLWVSLVAGGALALGLQPWLPGLLHGYPPSVVGLGRLALLLVPVMAFSDILMGMFDGAREYRLLTAFRLSLPVVQAAGLAVLLFGGWLTVTSAVWLLLAGTVTMCGLQYLVVARRAGVAVRPRPGLVREAGRYALGYYPALVADLALSFLDQIFLVPVLSPGDMGLYVIARRSAIMVDVSVAISQLLFTYAAPLSAAQGILLAQRVAVAGVVITGVLGAVLLLAARPLLVFLYGEAFIGAVEPFQVLLVGAFAIGVRKILAEGLSGLGKPQYGSAGQWIALAVMVLLLWVMVPTAGILGAVWAVTIAQWANLGVTGGLFWMERRRVMTAGSVAAP